MITATAIVKVLVKAGGVDLSRKIIPIYLEA